MIWGVAGRGGRQREGLVAVMSLNGKRGDGPATTTESQVSREAGKEKQKEKEPPQEPSLSSVLRTRWIKLY